MTSSAAVWRPPDPTVTVRPFLKWAGGKRSLLPEILPRLPARIGTYFEPFLGGGSVFFALAAEHRFQHAVLTDTNSDVIQAFVAIRDNVDSVVQALQRHRYERDHFYAVRAEQPGNLSAAEQAARTIFLNRTGFNGLYRVNRAGQFNVPFGRYTNPVICDADNLRAVSAVLRGRHPPLLAGADVWCSDFAACGTAKAGDAIYFDPPYVPVSKTASFTAYTRLPFWEPEQRRLAALFRELSGRGVHCLLSNSDCAFTRELYAGLKVETVSCARAINSAPGKRGRVNELLVSA